MKRGVIGAMLLSLAFAVPASAAESKAQPKVPDSRLEELRTQRLSSLDQQINRLQKEKECVKAAKTDDELNGCSGRQGRSIDNKKQRGPIEPDIKPPE